MRVFPRQWPTALGAILWLLLATVVAGETTVPDQASVGSREGLETDTVASRAYDGLVIDSIVIENRNVYDTQDPKYDNFIFRTANKLHFVTRPDVIRRELLLEVGGVYNTQKAEETARNLRTRYQLFDAWVESERLPNGHLLVRVVTVDQWSLVGGFELNREGNRTRYKLGFEERNFLGFNQSLAFDYVVQEDEKDYSKATFYDSRIFGLAYSTAIEHNTDPKDKVFLLAVAKPFYTLEQRFSYGATVQQGGGRADKYDDDSLVGQWQSHTDQFALHSRYRWGTRYDKIGLRLDYAYHADRTTDKWGRVQFPIDSLYHMPMAGVSIEHLSYTRMRRVSGFTFLEDFTVSTGAELAFGHAFTKGLHGYYYNRIDFTGWFSKRLDSSLLFLDLRRTYWLKGDESLRRYTELVGRYYDTRLSWLTVATRLILREDKSDRSQFGVTLGGSAGTAGGLRGYDEVARTGERLAVFNVETRLYPGIELLSVMFGGVLFADVGRVWKSDERFNLHNLEYSLGVGLRISLEKATKSEIIRIDFAVTRYGDLAVAFGTGQYF